MQYLMKLKIFPAGKLIFSGDYFILERMIALKSRARALYLLFLLCFITYAVSPLSFTYTENSKPLDVQVDRSLLSGEVLHIFLLELICSELSPKDDIKDVNSRFKILLRKLRAILSENKAVKLMDPGDIPACAAAIPSPAHPFLFTVSQLNMLKTHNGFYPSYSGLSPPSPATVS